MGRVSTIVLLLMAFASTIEFSNAAFGAISIDLGNQYIKIGLVKPGVPMEIVLNKDSRRKTPFVVGIKDGERFFGDAALQLAIRAPTYTFHSFLDLIGKQVDHPIVQKYIEEYPYLTIIADEKRGTVVFKTDQYEYSVETLLSMILWNVGVQCEAFAGQSIKNVIITAPAYFNHAERKALTAAVEIAGLNLLQLMTEGAATGLNYGVFRRKLITEEPKTLLIYDIGHTKTLATVVEYRLIKDKSTKEMYPAVSTIGIGYNRTLGGGELTRRLRKFLLEQFVTNYKPKGDITTNPRALAKLQKEAERLKLVLSANNDHFSQIEGLFENKDFRMKVLREQFQELFADIESDFLQPVTDALKMADLEADKVDLIALMGAGTRVPRLQQLFQDYVKDKEIGRFLNTDESIAMGLVYQAAHLSKGFKVKRFDVQELQLYPIQVSFISGSTSTAEQPSLLHRVLYGYKTNYPAAKKLISITSHTDDFNVNLNYGSFSHLAEQDLLYFGSRNITEVTIKGLGDTLKKEVTDESTVFKGVKIQFRMDHAGIVEAVKAEVLIERSQKSNSTFSAIVDKIGGLFSDSSSGSEPSEQKHESQDDSLENASNSTETESSNRNETNTDESLEKNTDNNKPSNGTETGSETKPKVLKVPLTLESVDAFLSLNNEDKAAATKLLSDFEQREREKEERDSALNSLEADIYDLSSKVEEESFTKYSTNDELDALSSSLSTLKTWLDEDVGIDNTKDEFVTRKNELDALAKNIRYRKKQAEERAVLVELLENTLTNISSAPLRENAPASTEENIVLFEKVVTETKEWLEGMKKAQNELADNQDPVMLVSEIDVKMKNLQREFQYLVKSLHYAKLREEENDRKAKEEEAAAKAKKEGNEQPSSEGGAETKDEEKVSESDVDSTSTATEQQEDTSAAQPESKHDGTEL